MTTDPAARPLPLRSHLRDLQAALDDATEASLTHHRAHGCHGSCPEARELESAAGDAQYQLGMTRFLNEEG